MIYKMNSHYYDITTVKTFTLVQATTIVYDYYYYHFILQNYQVHHCYQYGLFDPNIIKAITVLQKQPTNGVKFPTTTKLIITHPKHIIPQHTTTLHLILPTFTIFIT